MRNKFILSVLILVILVLSAFNIKTKVSISSKDNNDMLKEAFAVDSVIRKAEERLEWLSSDEETIKLYKTLDDMKLLPQFRNEIFIIS